MKKVFLFFSLASILLISCTSNRSSVDEVVDKYLQDSIVARMHDPKSFELVNRKYDSTYDHNYYQGQLEIDSTDLESFKTELADYFSTGERQAYRRNRRGIITEEDFRNDTALLNRRIIGLKDTIIMYNSLLKNPDSVRTVIIAVDLRGKNSYGALVLQTIKLEYNRRSNSITNAWQVSE